MGLLVAQVVPDFSRQQRRPRDDRLKSLTTLPTHRAPEWLHPGRGRRLPDPDLRLGPHRHLPFDSAQGARGSVTGTTAGPRTFTPAYTATNLTLNVT